MQKEKKRLKGINKNFVQNALATETEIPSTSNNKSFRVYNVTNSLCFKARYINVFNYGFLILILQVTFYTLNDWLLTLFLHVK